MKNVPIFFASLLLLALAACDDKAGETYVDTQSTSQFDTFQSSHEMDQLKAQLLTNPNDFNTLSRLADMYFESAQYFEAIQLYDRALSVNPQCADCMNDRGLALFYIGDADEALTSFDRAISTDPMFTHALLSKGFVLVSQGRFEEAREPLEKVKELDMTGTLAAEAEKFLGLVEENSPK